LVEHLGSKCYVVYATLSRYTVLLQILIHSVLLTVESRRGSADRETS
jgi:hypothetical protein